MSNRWLVATALPSPGGGKPYGYVITESFNNRCSSRKLSIPVDADYLSAVTKILPNDAEIYLEIDAIARAAFELGMRHQRRLDRKERQRKK